MHDPLEYIFVYTHIFISSYVYHWYINFPVWCVGIIFEISLYSKFSGAIHPFHIHVHYPSKTSYSTWRLHDRTIFPIMQVGIFWHVAQYLFLEYRILLFWQFDWLGHFFILKLYVFSHLLSSLGFHFSMFCFFALQLFIPFLSVLPFWWNMSLIFLSCSICLLHEIPFLFALLS